MRTDTYDITHKKILESGKNVFLKNGYERSNLRLLCRNAGITTGAFYRHFEDKESLFVELVEPVVKGLDEKYTIAENICFDYLEEGNVNDLWDVSKEALEEFIRYIFSNFDIFKLLLHCSDGTRYANFTDWIVEREIEGTYKMYTSLELRGIKVKRLMEKEMHMLTHAYFSCIFETVLHDFDEKTALECVRTLADFFSAGWRKVLDF